MVTLGETGNARRPWWLGSRGPSTATLSNRAGNARPFENETHPTSNLPGGHDMGASSGRGERGWRAAANDKGAMDQRSVRGKRATGNTGGGYGVAGRSMEGIGDLGEAGRWAGHFIGDVEGTGDIRLTNADCAEEFDIGGSSMAAPGTVMVLDDAGAVRPGHIAYDKRVAGVVSGAGSYRPAIVLDRREDDGQRLPIAMLGKVDRMVDAEYAPIGVGDLLTTSPTSGHAMKAIEPDRRSARSSERLSARSRQERASIPLLVALR